MINKVQLIGNLGKNPEVATTSSGKQYAKFSLATSESYKDSSGQRITNTEWHNVIVWDKLAEIAGKYLVKGSQIFLEGKIVTQKFEKDGQTRYSTSIVGREFQMLGSKPDQSNSNVTDEPSSLGTSQKITPTSDDDLPF